MTIQRSWVLLSCALFGTALAIDAFDACATEAATADGGQLTEIIVTAQKRDENLQNVPIAVAAFTAQTLAASNITGIIDLANVTPTLHFTYSGPVGSPYLRGVGSAFSYPGAEAEVLTYIDGVLYGSGAGVFAKFNNIDRIEVDKGPQGTLFGRNATGGVIQIFTREPSHEPTLDASVGYGNFNAKEADVYASDGFGANLAGDIAVHYDDHQGWGRNVFLNTDAFVAQNIGLRSKWVLDLSDITHLTVIGNYNRDISDLGSALVLVEAPSRFSLAAPIQPFLGLFSVNSDAVSRSYLRNAGLSVKFDTKLADLSFMSISAYQGTRSLNFLDGDESPLPLELGIQHMSEDQFSQEFQLASPTSARVQWLVGTYLYYNKALEDPARLQGLFLTPFGADSVDNYSAMFTRSAAVFGQASYSVTPTTRITGGFRYNYDYRTQNSDIIFNYPTGAGAPPPFLGIGGNQYPSVNFKAPTGKFTISQDISDHSMVYAGYNRGFKSGTFNNLIILSNPAPALKPEYIDAFEVGSKNELLDGRLRMNLSAFYYKYTNLQVNVFERLSVAAENAASSKIKGLDGDFEYAVTRGTRLTAGLSYLNAKYTNFENAPLYLPNSPTAFNPASGEFGGVIIGEKSAQGNTLPQAPKFSGYLGANQSIQAAAYGKIDLNATVSFQSKIYFTPDNLYSQGGYGLLSASAKWTSSSGKWDATLWGRNLTDRETFANYSISSFSIASFPNEPRTFGVRFGAHFK